MPTSDKTEYLPPKYFLCSTKNKLYFFEIEAIDAIRKVEVHEYPELGMEAVWKIEVEDFPAFIIIDDKGNDFFQL